MKNIKNADEIYATQDALSPMTRKMHDAMLLIHHDTGNKKELFFHRDILKKFFVNYF
jgi:hypothetical protein